VEYGDIRIITFPNYIEIMTIEYPFVLIATVGNTCTSYSPYEKHYRWSVTGVSDCIRRLSKACSVKGVRYPSN